MKRLLQLTCLAWLALPAMAAEIPRPVSPAGSGGEVGVSTRCPSFSWTTVGAREGYELVVFRVEEGAPVGDPVLREVLPAGASSWTPPVEQGLEPGVRYAWLVRALGSGTAHDWSEASVFQIVGAPSLEDVEAAMATLRRYIAEEGESAGAAAAGDSGRRDEGPSGSAGLKRSGGLVQEPVIEPKAIVAKSAPSPAAASLTVSDQIHLDDDSDFFKRGSVFLWDDASGNLAMGQDALMSASGTASNNTAVGREALKSTVGGDFDFESSWNTAVGDRALLSNTTGRSNTAMGFQALRSNLDGFSNTAAGISALYSNTSGWRNTAVGQSALSDNTSGLRNTAIGYKAGENATGSSNIYLGYGAFGVAAESNTIRIGGSTGAGGAQQNRTFIAGITGIGVTGSDVYVSSAGQLGVITSSRRFKEEIAELGEVGERLAALRPVTFRYQPELIAGGGDLEVGLIAEEVAEVFPELVTRGADGQVHGVRYELLSVLLLAELQRLEARMEELETGEPKRPRRAYWWRRMPDRKTYRPQ